ncbi:hypothetical protein AAV97_16800 [Acinetobacter sp. Ag2]|uniref:hypothetical protein n=1 Tax=Acinetobacter sp. Ag2 TaxID=1646532 RepID=UPI000629355A|nr:hypothetical protein [Acinetobacter sp. Ag2]KKW76590.1 hypothetical protein AAV97_16800 [Acinetobacter sp. Ag2]
MIKRELSITELFGVLSVVALTISVFSNAYFYYSLDAIWVMSILSPTFYIFEILKVLVLMAGSILVVGFLMDIFKWMIKKSYKFRQKKRFKLSTQNILTDCKYKEIFKQNESFQFWQTTFVIVIYTIIVVLFTLFGLIKFNSMLWNSFLIGLTLGIFTNKEIKKDKELKLFVFIVFFALITCFSAQIKLNDIEKLPVAKLKNDKELINWYVLDGSQDKLILLQQSSRNVIKIVKFEEIDRIISNKK